MRKVRVWDLVVRSFHWLTAILVLINFTILDEGDWHEILGYCAVGLLAVRIMWGFVGTRYARFGSFFPTWRRLKDHLNHPRSTGAEALGHNPLGALMIFNLLAALAAVGLTGHLMTTDRFWGTQLMEDLHAGTVNYLLLSVGIHIAGVLFESWRSRTNLIKAMVTGERTLD